MLEADGYEVKRGKNIALKGKDQQRFIRLRSLGEGYSEAEIRAVLIGEKEHQPKKFRKEKQFSAAPPELQLLIDVEAKRAEGKGEGYAHWARSFNLQQMAEAVCFIKEHEIGTYDELVEKTDAITAQFDRLSASIKSAETRLAEIAALKKHIINYSRTKETYAAYRKAGYSKKFLEEHREEIAIHKAAKEAFNRLSSDGDNDDDAVGSDTHVSRAKGNSGTKSKGKTRIPTIKQLNQEYAEVLSGKKKAYTEYRAARKEMQDYLIARKNIEAILGIDGEGQRREEQDRADREFTV